MTVGLDRLVLCKLAFSAAATGLGVLGWLLIPGVRRSMVSIPVVLIACIYCLAMLGSVRGVASNAFPCACIGIGYLFFTVTTLVVLGIKQFALAMLAGVFCYVLGGWYLYLFEPDYGVFPELLAKGQYIYRMGGMAHPNGFARSAVVGLLLSIYSFRNGKLPSFPLLVALLIFFGLAAYFAWSRTALFAAAVCVMVMLLDRLMQPSSIWLLAFAGFLAVCGLFVAVGLGKGAAIGNKIVGVVAKSGSTDELTSGTGRTEIWGKAISIISQKPITGNGFGAAPVLMKDFNQSTHNMLLHAAMVGGIGAGICALVLVFWMLFVIATYPSLFVRSMLVLILISGCMEDTILETFPGPCTMLWTICCIAPCIPMPVFLKANDAMEDQAFSPHLATIPH